MKRFILSSLIALSLTPASATEAEMREYGRVFADAKIAEDYCPGVKFNDAFFKNGIGGVEMSRKKEKKALEESIVPRMAEIKDTMNRYGVEYWCVTYKHLTSKKYKAPRSPALFDGIPREDDRFHEDG